MILKITYADDPDKSIEYIQIRGITIEADHEYAITDEDQDPYFEIENILEKNYHVITKHDYIEADNPGGDAYSSTDRPFHSLEVLTDNLIVIQKFE